MALTVGLEGVERLLQRMEESWDRRHDAGSSPQYRIRSPKRRSAIDRLRMALLRFVGGFFGTHKLDERNNP
jgi:hypothetical protein